MGSLAEHLRRKLGGRICWMGLGNPGLGDDGFGVRLAEGLIGHGVRDVVVAGADAEQFLGALDPELDHLVFLDAVEMEAEPGALVFLDAEEMRTNFPQISTHKISLGTLASCVQNLTGARVWLLGVQPDLVQPSQELTPMMQMTVEVLTDLLTGVATARAEKTAECDQERVYAC